MWERVAKPAGFSRGPCPAIASAMSAARTVALAAVVALSAGAPSIWAQDAPAKTWQPSFALSGYVEAAYTYGFEEPSNGILDYRGYDDRHNSFTLSNAVLDASGKLGGLSARVALQVGHTPDTYHLPEPTVPGSAVQAGSSASTWRFVQQAYAGYKAPVAQGLTIDAGIFLSPVGLETMAAKDDWSFSRSNLFFVLPAYHTGVRATLDVTSRTSVLLMLCNGWNNVMDNNASKTIAGQLTYEVPERVLASVLYMVGGEHPSGAPEGQPARHMFDGYVSADVTHWLSLATHWNTGFERTRFGASYWGGGAVYVRVRPASWLYVAARADRFAEHRGQGKSGDAAPIFFPASWVSSGTLTLDGRPHSNVSIRLEYRHDQASQEIYFEGDVKGDGVKTPFVANARAQNSLTVAVIAWF